MSLPKKYHSFFIIKENTTIKRYILLTILVFFVFILSCTKNDSSTANRVSKPGKYVGYDKAIYDSKYEITSQYVQVSDGTKLAMDLYRTRDETNIPFHFAPRSKMTASDLTYDTLPLCKDVQVTGHPAELKFDILAISMIFKAGHRIRLVINFADQVNPVFDPAPKAAIYSELTHSSYLTLPIIEVKKRTGLTGKGIIR